MSEEPEQPEARVVKLIASPHSWVALLVALSLLSVCALGAGYLVGAFLFNRPLNLVDPTIAAAADLESVLRANRVPAEDIKLTGPVKRKYPTAHWNYYEYDVRVPATLSVAGLEKVVEQRMRAHSQHVDISDYIDGGRKLGLNLSFGDVHFAVVRFAYAAVDAPYGDEPETLGAGLDNVAPDDIEGMFATPARYESKREDTARSAVAREDTRADASPRGASPRGGFMDDEVIEFSPRDIVAKATLKPELLEPIEFSPDESIPAPAVEEEPLPEPIQIAAAPVDFPPKKFPPPRTPATRMPAPKASAPVPPTPGKPAMKEPVAEESAQEEPPLPARPEIVVGRAWAPPDRTPIEIVPPPVEAPAEPVESISAPSEAVPVVGRMALILDDGGYGGKVTEAVLALTPRLTLAILPNTPACQSTARRGAELGFEIILHMPMENWNPDLYPHEGQLMVDMGEDRIAALTEDALRQVPQAVGVNNHMGSRFTSNPVAMARFLSAIQGRDLFFLDSRTAAESKAYTLSAAFGLPSLRRDLFIDHENVDATIRMRLRQAVELAKSQGQAIVIGHFRPITVAILTEVLPTIEAEGIEFVHLSELLP